LPSNLLGYRAPTGNMGIRTFSLVLSLTAFLLSGGQGSGQKPPKLSPAQSYWIVFDSSVLGRERGEPVARSDVFVMDQNGEHIKQLTRDHRSHAPSFSSRGDQIIFLRESSPAIPKAAVSYVDAMKKPSVMDAFRMDSDGKNATRVAAVGPDAQDVFFVPNSNRIGVRITDKRNLQVLVAPLKRLSLNFAKTLSLADFIAESDEQIIRNPRWHWPRFTVFYPPTDNYSPVIYANWANLDASVEEEINFQPRLPKSRDEKAMLRILDADGSVTSTEFLSFDTAWSPDASHISFSNYASTGARLNVERYPRNSGDGRRAMTEQQLDGHGPAWSSDGQKIAFMGLWKDSSQIFVIDANGEHLTQLSHNPEFSCFHPSWSPDGQWIVAECRPKLVVSIFGLAPTVSWYSNISLFDMRKPTTNPRILTKCWGPQAFAHTAEIFSNGPPDNNPPCGAHHPQFMPSGAP